MSLPSIVVGGIDIVIFAITLGTTYALLLAVSLSLNLEAGYAGVPNFGKVMFVAGGAALAGSVSGRVAALILAINVQGNYNTVIPTIIQQINKSLSSNPFLSMELLLLGICVAAGIGAAMGYLASYPAIRLREDYLGMLFLAAAQFFQIFLGNWEPFIGGSFGILVPDVFAWTATGTGVRDLVALGVMALFAALVYVYCEQVARSPLGRTLRAIRDNEIASRALGKDDVAIRRRVIIVASAISGIAGALITFYAGAVGPATWTRVTWTFWPWVVIIIGGAANNLGVVLGAFSFTFLMKFIDTTKFSVESVIPFQINWLEYLLFASMLILILAFRPGGILAEKSSLTLSRKTVLEIMGMHFKPKSPEETAQQAAEVRQERRSGNVT